MHRLSSSFALCYHGCDESVSEKVLSGVEFQPSDNDYDWLGPGIYFWEANPMRGLEYAKELMGLTRGPNIVNPAVVGAVVNLGLCLDLTTSAGIQHVRSAYGHLVEITKKAGGVLPKNNPGLLTRNLDCAVIRLLHDIRQDADETPVDTVRGVFLEGTPIYDDSGFYAKTHIQICVRNPACIKGVFRVPDHQMS